MSLSELPLAPSGVMQNGDKRGRILGFSTANLNGMTPADLPYGVYASETRVKGCDQRVDSSVTSYGTWPTFDGEDTRIETDILDLKEEICGCEIEVRLLSFIRGEARSATLDELIDAIKSDIQTAHSKTFTAAERVKGN